MKGAVEYFIVMVLVMFSVLLLFSFIGVTRMIHDAHAYRDEVVALIDNHEGDSVEVKRIMVQSKQCDSCVYVSSYHNNRLMVKVDFEVRLNILNFSRRFQIKGMSSVGGDGL